MNVDKSNIKWTGKELTTKEHYGALKFSKANLKYEDEKLVGGEFIVDMTTLDVQDLTGRGKERLEGHLRSDDFFSVDKHNNAYLKITEVIPAEFSRITLDEKSYELVGDLTIKDITHPITFTLKPENNQSFRAELTFDRSKYDVRFRSGSFFENLGDKLILDDIKLEVTLVKN
tara:strand:- start:7713 stop:8231 length:519 start_codon:yes stop_codon:yes gene_type:complete